jgi:hypothetical protein
MRVIVAMPILLRIDLMYYHSLFSLFVELHFIIPKPTFSHRHTRQLSPEQPLKM